MEVEICKAQSHTPPPVDRLYKRLQLSLENLEIDAPYC